MGGVRKASELRRAGVCGGSEREGRPFLHGRVRCDAMQFGGVRVGGSGGVESGECRVQ